MVRGLQKVQPTRRRGGTAGGVPAGGGGGPTGRAEEPGGPAERQGQELCRSYQQNQRTGGDGVVRGEELGRQYSS